MPRPGEKLHERQLTVRCPSCGAGKGHWCRGANSKCCDPHPQRRRAALLDMMLPFRPLDGAAPVFPLDRLKELKKA